MINHGADFGRRQADYGTTLLAMRDKICTA